MEEQKQESCVSPNSDTSTCTNISTQHVDVGVPIKLKPYAIIGEVETVCTGNPVVSLRGGQGVNCCHCCGCGCEIMITQTIAIKIPVTYGTSADVGETIVNCKK